MKRSAWIVLAALVFVLALAPAALAHEGHAGPDTGIGGLAGAGLAPFVAAGAVVAASLGAVVAKRRK